MTTKLYFSAAMIAAAASFSTGAQAESRFVTGTASPLTASANLDFTVTIPKFVYVRIGTGTDRANNTNVDNLVFTVPAANVGDGTSIAGTGGDLTGGDLQVPVTALGVAAGSRAAVHRVVAQAVGAVARHHALEGAVGGDGGHVEGIVKRAGGAVVEGG